MRVIPVAGNDSMLLNLSGAHAPFFTRNVVVLTDDAGHTGAGEVPGGEQIRQVLEDASHRLSIARSPPTTKFCKLYGSALAIAMPAGVDGRPSICASRCMRSPRSSARCST